MVYICNNLLILLETYCYKRIKGINPKKIFLFTCLLQLTFIIGFRNNVGADFSSYRRMYNYLSGIWQYRYTYYSAEIGYELLNRLCGVFGLPYWGLNFVCAFITNYFLIKAVNKFKCDPYLSIFLYISLFFFYHSMNQVRQGIAMTIGLFALAQLSRNKNVQFLSMLMLAMSFHMVAIVYLPLYFLRKIKIDKCVICCYVCITAFTIIFWQNIIWIISMTKYAHFIHSEYDMRLTLSSIVNLIARAILAIFVLKHMKRASFYNSYFKTDMVVYEQNILCHMVLLGLVFQIYTTFCNAFFGRVTTPYFMAYIIALPRILDGMHKKAKNIYRAGMYLFAVLYQIMYYILMGSQVLINDYSSIF